ncbi:hypothetical protein E2C01_018527 [Portunus trituberculatus]|uniref:Uncharacterized protein n=1 Tax=Portunus trituberculatus TaxID=210409 RepID=A0A5B7DVV3_PORTR|nr:hypothetical protein [Portunus trituberculatus]
MHDLPHLSITNGAMEGGVVDNIILLADSYKKGRLRKVNVDVEEVLVTACLKRVGHTHAGTTQPSEQRISHGDPFITGDEQHTSKSKRPKHFVTLHQEGAAPSMGHEMWSMKRCPSTPTTLSMRTKFVAMWVDGNSIRMIARATGVSSSTVSRWINRWKEEGNVYDRKGFSSICYPIYKRLNAVLGVTV